MLKASVYPQRVLRWKLRLKTIDKVQVTSIVYELRRLISVWMENREKISGSIHAVEIDESCLSLNELRSSYRSTVHTQSIDDRVPMGAGSTET